MAILQPNWLQTGSYSAKKDRRVMSASIMREGIVRKGHFALAQRAAGANLSVDVAAGEAWLKGDSAIDQGYYHVVNDATVNVPLSAANAFNPRIDAIVLAVNDSTEVGGSDSYLLEAIDGTPTAGATLANLKGAHTPGATKLLLGYVLVGAAATKVETAAMGGLRYPTAFYEQFEQVKGEPHAVAGAPPQYAHGRPLDWIPMCLAYNTATQSIPTSVYTAVTLPTGDVVDTEEIHNPAGESSKFVIKTPGLYAVQGNLAWTESFTHAGLVNANEAGGQPYDPAFINVTASQTQVNGLRRVGYGDYLQLRTFQASGVSKTLAQASLFICWQGI